MTRYGMLIDTTNCIGCYACRTACQRQNGLPPEVDYIRYEEREVGTFPHVGFEAIPLQCMHCEDAPCVSVCPTGASYIDPDNGTVCMDDDKCIGCRYCMAACPYQVRVHNKETGGVEKCRFCVSEAFEERGETCSCVEACVTGCRIFGDLDDPDGELNRAIAERNALPIAGDRTKAKVFYVR